MLTMVVFVSIQPHDIFVEDTNVASNYDRQMLLVYPLNGTLHVRIIFFNQLLLQFCKQGWDVQEL
jgi:hypothetical protein